MDRIILVAGSVSARRASSAGVTHPLAASSNANETSSSFDPKW